MSALVAAVGAGQARDDVRPVPAIATRTVPTITVEGATFRDLNRNGTLDPYENWRLAPERGAADLVGRMTLEEKAGAMMHGTAPAPFSPTASAYDLQAAERIILKAHVTSLITRLGGAADALAEQNNQLQVIAERSRLGVPITISTDPRHHFQYTLGASVAPGSFSKWPETLGLAAIGDAALVRRFGEIARQEYRAVGISAALSPQADLATEPRWPRIAGTSASRPTSRETWFGPTSRGFSTGRTGSAPRASSPWSSIGSRTARLSTGSTATTTTAASRGRARPSTCTSVRSKAPLPRRWAE